MTFVADGFLNRTCEPKTDLTRPDSPVNPNALRDKPPTFRKNVVLLATQFPKPSAQPVSRQCDNQSDNGSIFASLFGLNRQYFSGCPHRNTRFDMHSTTRGECPAKRQMRHEFGHSLCWKSTDVIPPRFHQVSPLLKEVRTEIRPFYSLDGVRQRGLRDFPWLTAFGAPVAE